MFRQGRKNVYMLDPDAYAKRVIELYGGIDPLFTAIQKRHDEFLKIWRQDAERMGRILRCHLAVEHFLTEFLIAANPHMGSLEDARLSFIQKIELLPDKDKSISFLKPGLRHLNAIRNRIVHRLRIDVTADDRDEFLRVKLFAAMRNARAEPECPKSDAPLLVIEEFAEFAASLLQASSSPEKEYWRQAAEELLEDSQGT